MYALLSVSDKEGIVDFGKKLISLGYKILSTSRTLELLRQNDIDAIDITSYTNTPEMFGGRVKTLNPKIAGGILYRRENESDSKMAKEFEILDISIVCVNLYPFKHTTQTTQDFEKIIENIDIGGPTLIRSGAKNYKSVLVITDKNDYDGVIEAIKNNCNTIDLRQKMMIKAYEHTASYDCMIANFMNKKFNNNFGDMSFIAGKKVLNTKYGENPHQKGALYEFEDFFTNNFSTIKGGVSFNNFTDINSATKIAYSFENAVCIVKHGNPCGFSIDNDLTQAYVDALKCDTLSAYGGVVAVNGVIDKTLAEKINETFIEVLVGKKITKEAIDVFENKKRIKLFEFRISPKDPIDFKHIEGGFLLQENDNITEDEIENMRQVGEYKANHSQLEDLKIAYIIAGFTKSNCITYVKNKTLVGIGMGMTSRVDASRNAILKAKDMNLDLNGSSMASEAFIPFSDTIEMASKIGVHAIIQPGGSIRDADVIECANKNKIPMYFTDKRHFLH